MNLPESVLVPCGYDLQKMSNVNEMVSSGSVVHPCRLEVKATVYEFPNITTCSSAITLFWEFSDNCGQETDFQQRVEFFSMQVAFQPEDGEINVDLGYSMKWPLYPNTDYYLLFLWKFDVKENKVGKVLFWNSYTLSMSDDFVPNTRYLWKIHYVLQLGIKLHNESIVPSPIWSFNTKPYPDYKLMTIDGPSEVYTGRYFEVLWKVLNVGSSKNAQYYWYDKVFISKNKNSVSGLLTNIVRRDGFMFPNDSYVGKARLSVPEDMLLGTYYIIVFVDYLNYIDQINRENSHGASLQSFEIKLTHPPDLQIDLIITPKNVFSGKLSFYIQGVYVYICMYLMHNPKSLKGCILLNLF